MVSDLMIYSRIEAATTAAGATLIRVDDPGDLPSPGAVDLVLVDWAARARGWEAALDTWCSDATPSRPRVILFGPHVDLAAHAAARAAGRGPMWARSKLLRELPQLVASG